MNTNDKPSFLALMKRLSIALREPIDDAIVQIYFEALSDIPLEPLAMAERRLERSRRTLPKPLDWREVVDEVVAELRMRQLSGRDGGDGEADPCQFCSDTGWRPVWSSDGVRRVEPCCRQEGSRFMSKNPPAPPRFSK